MNVAKLLGFDRLRQPTRFDGSRSRPSAERPRPPRFSAGYGGRGSLNGYGEKAGWGRAVKAGLRAARGDLLCYTNLARTTPQDLTLLVLYATLNPGTVVKANRKIRESFVRRAGSLLYNLECRALFHLSYWDINGTPKVFPRAFDKLLGLSRDDDLIDAEFNLICRQEGYPVLEVPIFCRGVMAASRRPTIARRFARTRARTPCGEPRSAADREALHTRTQSGRREGARCALFPAQRRVA